MSPGVALLNGDFLKRLNFIYILPGQEDRIFELYGNEYDLTYSRWLPYVALSVSQNYMLLGYETDNGYGAQLKITHSSNLIYLRTKINGNPWGLGMKNNHRP